MLGWETLWRLQKGRASSSRKRGHRDSVVNFVVGLIIFILNPVGKSEKKIKLREIFHEIVLITLVNRWLRTSKSSMSWVYFNLKFSSSFYCSIISSSMVLQSSFVSTFLSSSPYITIVSKASTLAINILFRIMFYIFFNFPYVFLISFFSTDC